MVLTSHDLFILFISGLFSFILFRYKKRKKVKIFVLPGGKMPERKSREAIGYDVSLRAIVSAFTMDKDNPLLRENIFDFNVRSTDPEVDRHVIETKTGLVYRLYPGEHVLGGVGFACEMKYPEFHWVAPRSGLASKHNITLKNAPGTIDPDYRGEAGVIITNESLDKNAYYDLELGMRIAQIIFQEADIPKLVQVKSHNKLSKTERSAGGFGSTGK